LRVPVSHPPARYDRRLQSLHTLFLRLVQVVHAVYLRNLKVLRPFTAVDFPGGDKALEIVQMDGGRFHS
jgi:hypothetical protein